MGLKGTVGIGAFGVQVGVGVGEICVGEVVVHEAGGVGHEVGEGMVHCGGCVGHCCHEDDAVEVVLNRRPFPGGDHFVACVPTAFSKVCLIGSPGDSLFLGQWLVQNVVDLRDVHHEIFGDSVKGLV